MLKHCNLIRVAYTRVSCYPPARGRHVHCKNTPVINHELFEETAAREIGYKNKVACTLLCNRIFLRDLFVKKFKDIASFLDSDSFTLDLFWTWPNFINNVQPFMYAKERKLSITCYIKL